MNETTRGRGRPVTTGSRSVPAISARTSPAIREALEALAAAAGVTLSAYVTNVLAQHVARAKGKK